MRLQSMPHGEGAVLSYAVSGLMAPAKMAGWTICCMHKVSFGWHVQEMYTRVQTKTVDWVQRWPDLSWVSAVRCCDWVPSGVYKPYRHLMLSRAPYASPGCVHALPAEYVSKVLSIQCFSPACNGQLGHQQSLWPWHVCFAPQVQLTPNLVSKVVHFGCDATCCRHDALHF